MSVERHLILQEVILRPAGEWLPGDRGWTVARVAEGSGYWMQKGNARALNTGDVLMLAPQGGGGLLRVSQLGLLKLQFFTVQPPSPRPPLFLPRTNRSDRSSRTSPTRRKMTGWRCDARCCNCG